MLISIYEYKRGTVEPKCDLAVQIAVAFKKIRYVSDSVPHLNVA